MNTANLDAIKQEINTGDLTHEEIATVFDTTIQTVDLVWLDMINQLQVRRGDKLFTLG